ncbi:MAG: TonB-dependent receptor [Flavobacteriales bacterium]|nr:TonB-dependent receptor [Flavobacteriales bacterium]
MKTRMLAAAGWMILSVFGTVNAQSFIEGSVTDESGLPLPGAAVKLEGASYGVTSGNDGTYRLSLRPGSHRVTASYVGYRPATETVENDALNLQVDFTLARREFQTDEVVISAVRAGRNAPVSQVTRNRAEIEKVYAGQDGAFLLEELSPSIVSYSESGTNLSGYGQMRLRGIDQTRINITLNGVPLNDMIDQGVFFSNFTDFGNSIESVQIQRGVGTSTNGTSSYAGSISFESISLLDTAPRAEIQMTGGSFNTRRLSAEVATGKNEQGASFYARYTRTLSDGFRRNASTDSRSAFFSGALFKERHTFKFTGFAGLSANGLAYTPAAISDIRRDPRTNGVSENDVDNFGQWMAQLQHIYAVNRDWSLVNTVYYNGAGGDFPFGFEDEEAGFTQINYPLYNDHYGVMSALNGSALGDRLKINAGLHANVFYRRNVEQIVPDYANPYYDDRTRKEEASGFAKANYTFNRFDLFGDVQVRAVRMNFTPDEEFLGFETSIPAREWLFINPTVGVNYRIDQRTSAYASFGRAGREPTRFDMLGSTQVNASNLPLIQDPNHVVPEYVNNWEAGVRYNKSGLSAGLNVFYMLFENEIAPIGEFIPEGFVQVYRNQERSYRRGVELDYNWQISPAWSLRGNATYMQAEISSYSPEGSEDVFENITPVLTPEWNVQTTLEYSPIKNLTLGLRTRYLSSAFMELTNDADLIVPESFVMDLRAQYRFYKEHSISVMFNNVLDNQYFTYGVPVFNEAAGITEPGFFVQPPRHIYATLHLRF